METTSRQRRGHGPVDSSLAGFMQADKMPELDLDIDTIREVQASWAMFVMSKGGPEAAEDAICRQLQKKEPSFAQLLYPHKASASRRHQRDSIEAATGQINHGQEAQRNMAALFKAAEGPGGGSGFSGGACPFAQTIGGLEGNAAGGAGAGGDLMDAEALKQIMEKMAAAMSAAGTTTLGKGAASGKPPAAAKAAGAPRSDSRPRRRAASSSTKASVSTAAPSSSSPGTRQNRGPPSETTSSEPASDSYTFPTTSRQTSSTSPWAGDTSSVSSSFSMDLSSRRAAVGVTKVVSL